MGLGSFVMACPIALMVLGNDSLSNVYAFLRRDWKDKLFHGSFVRDEEVITVEESRRWIRNGYLKIETKRVISVAQEQVLRTSSMKCYFGKTSDSPFCRLCGKSSESARVAHCERLF